MTEWVVDTTSKYSLHAFQVDVVSDDTCGRTFSHKDRQNFYLPKTENDIGCQTAQMSTADNCCPWLTNVHHAVDGEMMLLLMQMMVMVTVVDVPTTRKCRQLNSTGCRNWQIYIDTITFIQPSLQQMDYDGKNSLFCIALAMKYELLKTFQR